MHEEKGIMKGLEAHVEDDQPRWPYTQGLPVMYRCAQPGLHWHTHTHTHTLAPFFSQWQTSCRWLILEHGAPELGKMSERAYHWLQTYCLHCHINLIQKLSKGPLRFIPALFVLFYFWKERGILLWSSNTYCRVFAAGIWGPPLTMLHLLPRICLLHL